MANADIFLFDVDDGTYMGAFGTHLGIRKAVARMRGLSNNPRDYNRISILLDDDDPETLLIHDETGELLFFAQPLGHPDIVEPYGRAETYTHRSARKAIEDRR